MGVKRTAILLICCTFRIGYDTKSTKKTRRFTKLKINHLIAKFLNKQVKPESTIEFDLLIKYGYGLLTLDLESVSCKFKHQALFID